MILPILTIGHPLLREPAQDVTRGELLDAETQQLIDDLVETMRHANGAGLAATQVGVNKRICVIEVNANPRYPYKPDIPLTILVNPKLHPVGEETFANFEGCLSVPGLRGVVERHAVMRVEYWDRFGNRIDTLIRGLKAATYQHEVDHLDGILFVDRVKDPRTFSSWESFDTHHKAAFAERVEAFVARHGS